MAKVKNDYFKMIEQQVEYCVEASSLMEEILSGYSADKISADRERIHEIEHSADKFHHEILGKLYSEFITPIDQEDILRLVQIVDDITDALDEVIMECYMFHVVNMPAPAKEMSKLINQCVKALYDAVCELKNFKKPEKLRKHIVTVNDIEAKADGVYVDALHNLFGSDINAKELFTMKTLYESLESCCDLCEYASDIIEQIIIKNT